jgi:predicted acylesterase/phospholipase RssA
VNDTDFTPKLARDHHLFGPGPKRILSLDGGGVRGAISVAFLERIEAVLQENLGKQVRLGDYFDLIGGTSTGAIIAGALALGYNTKNIGRFYHEVAPRIFLPSRWRLLRLQSKFDATALREEIEAVVGDLWLGSPELITGLCIVSKRMDTGSPWILANNPKAPYWKTKAPDAETGERGYSGNEHYKLANLVRASTAAPFYFDPELLEIVEGEPLGLFVDGGVTPHNNPVPDDDPQMLQAQLGHGSGEPHYLLDRNRRQPATRRYE